MLAFPEEPTERCQTNPTHREHRVSWYSVEDATHLPKV
jgi:hypothetical protein